MIKNKLAKICADWKVNWVNALLLALIRMQTNRNMHLTLHEIFTGRPMSVPWLLEIQEESRGPRECSLETGSM